MEISSEPRPYLITRRGMIARLGAGAVAAMTACQALRADETPQTQGKKGAKPSGNEDLLPSNDEETILQYEVTVPAEDEAVFNLAPVEDRFVKPVQLRFMREEPVRARLYFQFQGPEDPNRVVRVSIELLDSEGESICTVFSDEKDARPKHRANRGQKTSGFAISTFCPNNDSTITFKPEDFKRAKRAVITFEEL